jgi:endonuclease/exonuclease/phosphatase (EEP) superfamily protein YafD
MASDILRIVLLVLGYAIVLVSLIPLVRKDNWVFRVFEYPRSQKLLLNAIILLVFTFVARWDSLHDIIFSTVLCLNLFYLLYQVVPYTVVGRKQMKKQKQSETGKYFKLLICNVYQYNRRSDLCLACIQEHDPDLLLLVETDEWWNEQLSALRDIYTHNVLKPLNNTYGMLLHSRFELMDPQVKYLVESDVPSIHTRVRLPSGDVFRLYCLHPRPPIPQESARSTERDGELLIVARDAKESDIPVVVAGDLNDVAWSYTTELFLKTSELLDPRRGRGFFNTFHADHWFLRWPLDHVFCSRHFLLRDLKRLKPMGSDHFPILVELGLPAKAEKQKAQSQHVLRADHDEEEQAQEKIAKVR